MALDGVSWVWRGLVEIAVNLEPFYPNLARETAQSRWLNGQTDAAIALAKSYVRLIVDRCLHEFTPPRDVMARPQTH